MRSLDPLPRATRKPTSRLTRPMASVINSVTRNPVPERSSSMAASLWPRGRSGFGCASNRSTSATLSTVGRWRRSRGDVRFATGLFFRWLSRTINLKKPRIAESSLALLLGAKPCSWARERKAMISGNRTWLQSSIPVSLR